MAELTRYQAHRASIRSGDAIALRGRGVLSRLIEIRSYYSHAAMCLWLRAGHEDRLFIAHAIYPTGLCFVQASTYLASYDGDADLCLADHGRMAAKHPGYQDMLVDWMVQHSAAPYDAGGVLGFVLPWSRQRANAYYCSEAISSAWQAVGAVTPTDMTPEQVVAPPLYLPGKVPLT